MPSGNAEKRSALAGGRPTDARVDLRISDASEDTERGAEGRPGRDEKLQSAITGERSTRTTLSGPGGGRFRHRTHPRGRNYVERKR